MTKYPYFIYPDILALRKGVDDEHELLRLRRRVAANVGDIPSLRLILGLDPEEFASFYPDMMRVTPSTADTIDAFLERFGNRNAPVPQAAARILAASGSHDDSEAITPGVREMVYTFEDTPAPADEAARVADSTASAIDSFLAAVQPAASREDACVQPQPRPDAAPAQTLRPHPAPEDEARQAIKNHDYQAALEIIMRRSLNNPEKSVYFADQIRFLRKLILNQTKQNNSDAPL